MQIYRYCFFFRADTSQNDKKINVTAYDEYEGEVFS